MYKSIKAIAVLCLGVAFSSPSTADDLWGVYQVAKKLDAQYLAAQAEYKSAQYLTPLAKSARRLQISVQDSRGNTRTRPTKDADVLKADDDRIDLTAQMTIYNRALNREVSQAKLRTRAAAVVFAKAQAALIMRVADRYFKVLESLDNYEVAKRQRDAIKRQRSFARDWLKVGLGTQVDLYDAQAREAQAQAELIQAENQIAIARQNLKQIIGAPVPKLIKLNDDAPLHKPTPDDISAWVAKALKNNFDLQIARLQTQVAKQEIKKQRAASLPTFDITAISQRRDVGKAITANERSSAVHGVLRLPLFTGGGNYYRAKRARLGHTTAVQNETLFKRRTEADATAAFLAVTNGLAQVKALREAVRAGELALEGKQDGFRAELTTNLDVLDAQRDLASSQFNYLSARYNFILSVLRLEEVAGQLDEEDLKMVNAWLAGK